MFTQYEREMQDEYGARFDDVRERFGATAIDRGMEVYDWIEDEKERKALEHEEAWWAAKLARADAEGGR